MRILFCFIFPLALLFACNDEDIVTNSEFIILNEYENKANIASFEYPTKNITQQLITVSSPASLLSGAAKNKNYLYLHTGYPGKFRQIDIESKSQTSEVESWFENFPFINFNDSDIIVCHFAYDNMGVIKVYNQNLSLQDSVVVPDVMNIYDAVVSNNKLFFSTTIIGEGSFIKVMDLSSLTITSSIETTSNSCLFYQFDENNILVIEREQYYFLNANTLSVSNIIESSLGDDLYRGNFDLNRSENSIYYLRELSQPSAIPYVLAKVNLATGESEDLSNSSSLLYGPLIYDDNNKVIICVGDSDEAGLHVLSESGQLIHQTDLPVYRLFRK